MRGNKGKLFIVTAINEVERLSVHCKTENKAKRLAHEYKRNGYLTHISYIKSKAYSEEE